MCKICPKCRAIAEYNAYYGRITCTRCAWEGKKEQVTISQYAFKPATLSKSKRRKMAKA